MIPARRNDWAEASPTMSRTLGGITDMVIMGSHGGTPEARWIHAALTSITARDHDTAPRMQRPAWSLRRTSQGWRVFWWSEDDAEAFGDTMHHVRIGNRDACEIALSASRAVDAPPQFAPGAHAVALHALSPVCSKSRERESRRVVWHREPRADKIAGGLRSLAERIGVDAEPMHAHINASDYRTHRVVLGGKRLGHRHGWTGRVELVVNAPARWMLECASRGLGLGGSAAFGMGHVRVEPCR